MSPWKQEEIKGNSRIYVVVRIGGGCNWYNIVSREGLLVLVVLDLQAMFLLFVLTGKHVAGSNLRP
jgi:hypothetical protein